MAKGRRKKLKVAASRTRAGRRKAPVTPQPVGRTLTADASHEPMELKDGFVEQALSSGEQAGLLEDYFGAAQYAELKKLSQEAALRRSRAGERVLILPGIMGSKLGYDGIGRFDDV